LGLNRLTTTLRHHRRIAFDSSVFIYQIEAHPKYLALTDAVFAWLDEPNSHAVTAALTMTEILVVPHRNRDKTLLNNFYGLLSTYPNLEWVSIDLQAADVAARLRAEHRLLTPDALQAAIALQARATALVTNDPVFRRVPGFASIVLEDFL
jgi:predicted nucleic acid-binding protein